MKKEMKNKHERSEGKSYERKEGKNHSGPGYKKGSKNGLSYKGKMC